MQERADYSNPLTLTEESITAFLRGQEGQKPEKLQRWGSILRVLRTFLPESKELTRENLLLWRRSLVEHGYASQTITWQGKTFSLGCYGDIEEANEARRGAERILKENTADVPEAINAYRKTLPGCSRERQE